MQLPTDTATQKKTSMTPTIWVTLAATRRRTNGLSKDECFSCPAYAFSNVLTLHPSSADKNDQSFEWT